MSEISGSQIIEALNWRYAIKKFDPSKKLTGDQITTLSEVIRLSASSFGIQPWHFVIVSNQEVKLKLQAAAFGQAQLADSSHVVVFTQKLDAAQALDDYIASTATNRGVTVADLAGMKEYMANSLSARPAEALAPWMARQPYIALGTLLEAAALLKIDACPMEGFIDSQFNEILGLDKQGLSAVAIVTLGFRFADDEAATVPRNRFSRDEALTFIK